MENNNKLTKTLTNGTETFKIYKSDAPGTGLEPDRWLDETGSRYERCKMRSVCDHSNAPVADTAVWHDYENTETLWEVK